jgi:MFS family permease
MVGDYLRRIRLFSRDARLFLVCVGCIGLAYYGGAAVLQNLFLLRLGYGPEFIGLVFAVGSLMPAIFAVPAQTVSRRWGIRRAMIAGIIVMPLGAILLPFAEFVGDPWQRPLILAASALSWLGGPLFMVNGAPFLAGACGPEERAHAFSMFAALFPLAGFVGGTIAGGLPALFARVLRTTLDAPGPFRLPLWLAATLYVPGMVALLATRRSGTRAEQRATRATGSAPTGAILIIGLVAFLRMTAQGTLQSFFNVYLDDVLGMWPSAIGVVMGTGQLVGGLAALTAPLLIGRYGRRRTFAVGSVAGGVSYVPLALVGSWLAAGVSFLGITAMGSVCQPTLNLFGQEVVAARWRSMVSSATVMAMGLGYSVAGLGGGLAIGLSGYRPVFTITGALPVLGAVLFWAYFRPSRYPVPCAEAVEVAE